MPRRWRGLLTQKRTKFVIAALAVATVGICLWVNWRTWYYNKQQVAIKRIRAQGAFVFVDIEWLRRLGAGEAFFSMFFDVTYGVDCRGRSHLELLQALADLPGLVDVYFDNTPLTGADLEPLSSSLKELSFISLNDSGVRAEDLVHLAKFPNLEVVWLDDKQSTLEGLTALTRITRLRRVSVQRSDGSTILWAGIGGEPYDPQVAYRRAKTR